MNDLTDRFSRQQDLVPQERLEKLTATGICCGAIGRQVALQLAAMGVRSFILIDHDTVDLSNVTTQGYCLADVRRRKVHALGDALQQFDGQIKTAEIPDRFRPDQHVSEILFCCVDSIETRAAIWRKVGRSAEFWADGRMRGEVLRVLSVGDESSRRHYSTTLFPEAEAQVGTCTARSTLYAASIAAGLMIHQFARWLRGQMVEADLTLNLLASEMTTRLPESERGFVPRAVLEEAVPIAERLQELAKND